MVLLRTTLPVPYKPSAFRLYTLFVPACSPASSAATHLGFLPHLGSSGIMGAVANDVVKHVWIGRANTMDEMIEQCKEPGGGHTLHLLQGARARIMDLDVLDDGSSRQPLSHFRGQLDCEFLGDHRYMTLAMMVALSQAINTAVVVRVEHPTSLANSSFTEKARWAS